MLKDRRLTGLAILARRQTIMAPVDLGEMRERDEAAGDRDLRHGHVGLPQHAPSALQTELYVILRRRRAEVALAQALQLALRNAGFDEAELLLPSSLDPEANAGHGIDRNVIVRAMTRFGTRVTRSEEP